MTAASPDHDPAIVCRKLTIAVPDKVLVKDLDLSSRAGECLAILGPNGVGKTLTMLSLCGLRDADRGCVAVRRNGREQEIGEEDRRELARTLALLPQHIDDVFPASVFETVMIGRHPHVGRLRLESAADRKVAGDALATMNLQDFHDRDVTTLSGGERRRLAIAQLIAQEPRIFLLDEPTNHLDPQHQLDVMQVFRQLAAGGRSVITTLHDINLATRFADRCLLLYGDGNWALGETSSVLTADSLSELFNTRIETARWRDATLFVAAGHDQATNPSRIGSNS